MSRFAKVTVALLFGCCVVWAQDAVPLAGEKLSFVPPPGFQAMSEQAIRVKYPRGNPPRQVYANDRASVSIAISFTETPLKPDQLAAFKAAMEGIFPQVTPGLTWVTREILKINGVDWIHFEFTSPAVDTQIHNDIYMTSFEGKQIGFNFNATVAQYANYKD
jgi:hypothetical protein